MKELFTVVILFELYHWERSSALLISLTRLM